MFCPTDVRIYSPLFPHSVANSLCILQAIFRPRLAFTAHLAHIIRHSATAQLDKNYFKTPACIPVLSQILASFPEEPVRQIAAVELRERVSQKNGATDQRLPSRTGRNQAKKSRTYHRRTIQARTPLPSACRRCDRLRQAPELTMAGTPPLINRCCTSPQVHERELGAFIPFAVLKSIVVAQRTCQRTLHSVGNNSFGTQKAQARVTTVRSLGVLAQYTNPVDKHEIQLFQQVLVSMITVAQDRLDQNNETSARHPFDTF